MWVGSVPHWRVRSGLLPDRPGRPHSPHPPAIDVRFAKQRYGPSALVRLRESTRRKIAGNVLSALRNFGVLNGTARKKIEQPTLMSKAALDLCRLLYDKGLRGWRLTEASDWRLSADARRGHGNPRCARETRSDSLRTGRAQVSVVPAISLLRFVPSWTSPVRPRSPAPLIRPAPLAPGRYFLAIAVPRYIVERAFRFPAIT